MLVLVNANNGGRPLGEQNLNEIRLMGVDGFRTDVLADGAEAQLAEFVANADLQLLALIHGDGMPGDGETMVAEAVHAARIATENLGMGRLPHPPIFELGNEPTTDDKQDYWKKHPENFGNAVARASRRIWEIAGEETLVISGGIHNPGGKTQDYLKKAAKHFPRPGEGNFAVGFHNYAPGMGDPDRPQKGFRNVEDQIRRLRDHGYPLFDTESGGHTGRREGHTEEQIAQWLTRRLDQSLKWGLLGTVVYQLNDGDDPTTHESSFGLLRLQDRSLKPSGRALTEWMERHAAEA